MAEKESLRRQIELLQGIINKHKNVHGNVPAHVSSTTHTWKNPAHPTHSTRGTLHAGPSQRDYQQQQHQQQKTQQQYPGNTWRQQYSLVNRPQGPTLPSSSNNVPPATSKTFSQDLCQKSSPKMTATKGLGTLTTAKGTISGIKPHVWTGTASGDNTYVHAARKVPSAVNPGVAASRTSLGRIQSTGREEPAKSAPVCLLSQQQSLTEGRDNRKPAHLKQQAGTSIPSTSAVKTTSSGISATKWTSELCRTRSESAFALLAKTPKSPTLPSHEPHWTSPLKKSEPYAAVTSDSKTRGRLGGSLPKVGNYAITVVPTSSSQVTPPVASANPLKRRLVSSHRLFSPQKSATPTPPGKVSKCKKTKYTWVANPAKCSRTSSATPAPPGKVLKCKKTNYTWVANPTKGNRTASATPTPPGKVSKCKKTNYTWVANPAKGNRTASATPTPPGKVSKCKKTNYTWVANPTKGNRAASVTPTPPGKVSKCKKTNYTWVANPVKGNRTASATPATPGKVSKCRKTKYTWVANPAKGSRTSRKSVSPKAPESAKKTPIMADKMLPSKVSPKGDVVARLKKTAIHSKGGTSSSKYKWKATNPVLSISPSKSKFKWQAETEKEHEGSQQSGARASFLQALEKSAVHSGMSKSPFGESAHPGYKVKSRTKIIRRKSFTGSPADNGSPLPSDTIKSHYFLRRRTPPKAQTVKKVSPRGLVQISKHRLRRLPAPKQQMPTREGCSPHAFRSPSTTKVIKTRYKIVKRSTAASLSISPTLLWKARKLSAARWLLLNRMRQISPTAKSNPLQQQRWKSRGLRCIGGVMYRVSANKLSKHTSPPFKANDTSKYFTRSGRLDCNPVSPSCVSPTSTSRSATPSRYIASRAVQRSLAIIRQAKQKKEKKKEYCMYYNRFGKCNRGESCPYIHDPEKVAVCTRFLRGTCKKTDGTCSFSHKVSKEKMPVCSFFLRGICNNNDCPYSHVYVSRKAEVCQDFLKGYCPMGEKCKKKHTLLCPDFAKTGSCPKGAQCKLQHRQRKHTRRPSVSTEHSDQERMTPRQGRQCEGTSSRFQEEKRLKSASESAVTSPSDLELPGSRGLRKLPSFISLKSSPTSPIDEGPIFEREKASDDIGKPIQIKPRL